MSEAETKARILEIALKLFSRKGYSSVSIRDICGKVGIKESSVYYHFKNKQDIFDVLCKSFMDVSYALPGAFNEEAAKVTAVSDDDFLMVCQSFLNDYLMNEKINQFLRMLIIEQGTNPQAAALYHKVLFDDAIEGQKAIFSWLAGMGFLRDDDVEGMVMAYYAPVLYMFQRYLVSQEITEEVRTEVNQKLLKHVDYFLSEYKAITEKRDQ